MDMPDSNQNRKRIDEICLEFGTVGEAIHFGLTWDTGTGTIEPVTDKDLRLTPCLKRPYWAHISECKLCTLGVPLYILIDYGK